MSVNLTPEKRSNPGDAIAEYHEIRAEIEKISALNREVMQSASMQDKLFDTQKAKADEEVESINLKIKQLGQLERKQKCCNVCKVFAGIILASLVMTGIVYGFVRNPYV